MTHPSVLPRGLPADVVWGANIAAFDAADSSRDSGASRSCITAARAAALVKRPPYPRPWGVTCAVRLHPLAARSQYLPGVIAWRTQVIGLQRRECPTARSAESPSSKR